MAARTPWGDAAAPAPLGGAVRGVGFGVTHLLALDAGQPGEPRFALLIAPHSYTPAAPWTLRHGRGGLSPAYSPAAAPARPRAPRRDPAAARPGRGHRRTGRNPPARAGRGVGSGGCPRSGRGARRDRHSPSRLSSRGCRGLPGEGREELAWELPGWMVLSIPPSGWGRASAPLRPPSPTLSPLGPAGPGLSWGGGDEEGALGI